MKDNQKLLCKMLEIIIRILDELNVPYFIIEGCCIGAIRHKGFIPWDDDIDIGIPSDYYPILEREFEKKLPEGYKVAFSFDSDKELKNLDVFTRIYYTGIKYSSTLYGDKPVDVYPFVDIMFMYGLPKGKYLSRVHFFYCLWRKFIYKLANYDSIEFNATKKRSFIEKLILSILRNINTSKYFDRRKELRKLEKILMKYSYEKADEVFAFPSDYRQREIVKKYIYGNGKIVPFEHLNVRIPEHWDAYLTSLYGDYMTPPPVEMRTSKHQLLGRNE